MPETRIDSASESNLRTAITEYSVDYEYTDGALDQKETKWSNTKYPQYLGYYKTIPELRAVIDAKSTWTIGKGYKTSPDTEEILAGIKGFGYDSFNTIMESAIRTYNTGGDAYIQIIRDEDGELINLKPLDPSVMEHVANREGIIIRFEQRNKIKGEKPRRFKPEEIFYLARNRVADEIHGTAMTESLEWIIKAKNAVQEAMKTIMQRHVKPVMIFHLDTDDSTEVAAFKAKMDKTHADGENIYIPKDVVVPEVLSIAPNATLNPLPWLEYLNKQFYQTAGVPQIIAGGSSEFTEKATSVVYLAFQQSVEADQLYLEEQIGLQLGIEINFEFPASLENDLLTDKKKDGAINIDASQTTAGAGEA